MKTKPPAKAIVLTAHGRASGTSTISLNIDLVTTCKIGETHQGKHLNFRDLSIFTSKYYLYDYLLTGYDDYTSQGEVIPQSTPIPQILLSPLLSTDTAKKWSWQKPQVEEHFRKMCIYDLKNLPTNPLGINYTNVNSIDYRVIYEVAHKTHNIKLINHCNIVKSYIDDTNQFKVALDSTHVATMTYINSSGIYIFDYEQGPSIMTGNPLDDIWPLQDATLNIGKFCSSNGIDCTGVDSFVLKACLDLV